MNGNLEPRQFDTRFLATVIAIIVLSLAALVWGWRNAHSSQATSHASSQAWAYDDQAHDVRVSKATANPATATRNP